MISGGIEVNLLKIAYHLERNLCKSTLLISSEIIWKETRILLVFSQLTFTFSKSTTETLEKGVKYFQSYIGERERGTFQKLSHLGGRGACTKNNSENRGLIQKWGSCHFFITLQFNRIYCVLRKSKVSFITFWFFSLLS